MKNFKYLIILISIATIFSCKSDDDINLSNKLVGEWLRADFTNELEYKLIFNDDNVGFRTFKTGNTETGITSSAVFFNWSVNDNTLTFSESYTVFTTSFSFNLEDQLILKEYSDLPFIRIK